MVIKSKRPYKWIAGILLTFALVILITQNVQWWKMILLFGVIALVMFFVISDLVIDEEGILHQHPFIPFLSVKKITWTEIDKIEVTIKSVLTDGIKNPSTLEFFYKNGRKYRVSYEPTSKDVEVLKSMAYRNNVTVKTHGLPPLNN